MAKNIYQADVTIVGGGLAGITSAIELLDQNKSVNILERDVKDVFGGLAKRSFGGVMAVGTKEQKRMGIKDSVDLALSDWHSFAEFEENDVLPRQWAEFYVNNSIEYIYDWLKDRGVEFLPVVNWPERGMFLPGNSVPRWHIAWGTGLEIIRCLVNHLESHANVKKLNIYYGHNVQEITSKAGIVVGCAGHLEKDEKTSFTATSDATIIASGGICGGDLSMVRKNWYKDWGKAPKRLLNGSHQYADGQLHEVVKKMGGKITHLDKQWHYAAGIAHPEPTMDDHGISLVPPRSAMWINPLGERIGPVPLMGYTDTRYLVEQICKQPGQFSWQILNYKIAKKELAVSGSQYMTAFKKKSKLLLLKNLIFGNKALVNQLINESSDFVVADSLSTLVEKMNKVETEYQIDKATLSRAISMYDAQIDRGEKYFTDYQLLRIANFRKYRGDKIRTCNFQKIIDPKAMPLIAIRERILSRKSLGGIQTDLQSRVLNSRGKVVAGLYAIGEAAGFGGGGIHGKGVLEGTFLGSCVLNGRVAAKSIAGKAI